MISSEFQSSVLYNLTEEILVKTNGLNDLLNTKKMLQSIDQYFLIIIGRVSEKDGEHIFNFVARLVSNTNFCLHYFSTAESLCLKSFEPVLLSVENKKSTKLLGLLKSLKKLYMSIIAKPSASWNWKLSMKILIGGWIKQRAQRPISSSHIYEM